MKKELTNKCARNNPGKLQMVILLCMQHRKEPLETNIISFNSKKKKSKSWYNVSCSTKTSSERLELTFSMWWRWYKISCMAWVNKKLNIVSLIPNQNFGCLITWNSFKNHIHSTRKPSPQKERSVWVMGKWKV